MLSFPAAMLSARARMAASAAGNSVRRECRTRTRGTQNPGSTCNSYSTVTASSEGLCGFFSNSQVPCSAFRSPLTRLKSIRCGGLYSACTVVVTDGISHEYFDSCSITSHDPSGADSTRRQCFTPGMNEAAWSQSVSTCQMISGLALILTAAFTMTRDPSPSNATCTTTCPSANWRCTVSSSSQPPWAQVAIGRRDPNTAPITLCFTLSPYKPRASELSLTMGPQE